MVNSRPPLGWDVALARLALGGMFLFTGWMKFGDWQNFAFAIKGFKLLPPEVIPWVAYYVPYAELLVGALLVLGLLSRAAALVGFAMLLGFIGAMGSVLWRGLDVECGCFGDYFGDTKITWLSIARNVIFLGLAAPVLVRGPGILCLDGLIRTVWGPRRATVRPRPRGGAEGSGNQASS